MPTPTERAIERLPRHLRRYVVPQEYADYTARDQAVWRHIMRRLRDHLADKAHPIYLDGLAATGIGTERIPSLDDMNARLAGIGWSAVAVRGFVPPSVFTELQALGVLAIAADIRDHEHIEYTPAPDIVHESAGHAPILASPRYAEYLRRSGYVGFRAIASSEDEAVFRAVRNLSVVKEDPAAPAERVALAQEHLLAAKASRRYVSENAKASRLYWWTAEYGLVGRIDRPHIYGAGLLSSIGEADRCLTDAVKKVPLSLDCIDVDFDITRMQPQLFVARDFEHLFEVLGEFEATLACKRGGDFGLDQAIVARTVNHLVLDDGLELTGRVVERVAASRAMTRELGTAVARLEGPVLVSRDGRGLGRPLTGEVLVLFGRGQSLPENGPFSIELSSGLFVTGFAVGGGEVVNLRGHLAGRPLDLPSCTHVFTSKSLPSVAGGAADPEAWDRWFGELDTLAQGDGEARARAEKARALDAGLAALYEEVRALRERGAPRPERLRAILEEAAKWPGDWLLKSEIEELLGSYRHAA